MYFKTYLNILEFKVQSSVATLVDNVSNSFLDVSVGNFLLYKTSYTHTLAYLDNQSNCSPIVSIEKFTTNIKCNVVTIRAFFFFNAEQSWRSENKLPITIKCFVFGRAKHIGYQPGI